MSEKIIIYGKAGCPYTSDARAAYGENVEYFDVMIDSSRLDEMLKLSKGVRKVPVIVDGDKIIIGYGGS
jgi:glutaredoxin